MTGDSKLWEYAGFEYKLILDQDGRAVAASPVGGQHPASAKEKHRRAALDTYNQRQPI